MCLTLHGRVRRTLGPPSSRSHLLTNRRPVRLHAVCCHCSWTGLNVSLVRIDLRPSSLVHVQVFFVGPASSDFSDCDLFNFLGDVCNGLGNDFVLGLAPASFIFFAGLIVLFPVSLRFLLGFILGGIWYKGRSFLKVPLNLLISSRQLVVTMIDFGSNVDRCNPASDLTLDSATYAIPALKTLSERSTIAHSLKTNLDICVWSQHRLESVETVFCRCRNFS